MNYRNLTDRELVTLAESQATDPLTRELLYRLARQCDHALANEKHPTLTPRGGVRTGLL